MGGVGPCREVEQLAGAEVHLGEHENGDPVVESGAEIGTIDDPELGPVPEEPGQTLRHVEVGREVLALGEDHRSVGAHCERSGEQLEQVDFLQLMQLQIIFGLKFDNHGLLQNHLTCCLFPICNLIYTQKVDKRNQDQMFQKFVLKALVLYLCLLTFQV